jgi:hypothetical protein
MLKDKKMHRKFESFMAEKIENELFQPVYEGAYSQDVIETIVDGHILIDYVLTVKDDMVTIELEEAPSKEAKFDDKMYSKDITLVKINDSGSTANYRIESTDDTEKKTAEEKMITLWLTTLPDNHENWDWDGSILTLLDKDMQEVATVSREELVQKIAGFPKS